MNVTKMFTKIKVLTQIIHSSIDLSPLGALDIRESIQGFFNGKDILVMHCSQEVTHLTNGSWRRFFWQRKRKKRWHSKCGGGPAKPGLLPEK